jgi:hypothetical protein
MTSILTLAFSVAAFSLVAPFAPGPFEHRSDLDTPVVCGCIPPPPPISSAPPAPGNDDLGGGLGGNARQWG